MEIINLEGTEDTPKIILDKTNKIFEISGRSLPEDSAEFYQPVLDWLSEYANDPLPETIFDFKLEYFNTSSSKALIEIFRKFERVFKSGNEVLIQWYYEQDDEDMLDLGEEFSENVGIPFEIIGY